jgi:hypothetical protein
MFAKRVAVILIVVSVLAGNAAAQKNVNAPDTFRGADATTAGAQNSIGDLKWFEVFKDDALQQLVRTGRTELRSTRRGRPHQHGAR